MLFGPGAPVHTPPGDSERAEALEAMRAELAAARLELSAARISLEATRAELAATLAESAALADRAQIEHEILEAAPTALMLVDRRSRITRVNRHAELLFGYPRQELLGQSITVLMPERLRPGHPELMRGYFAAPQPRPMGAGRDLYGRHQDGREIPIEIGLMPIETREGTATLASIIDISERKRAEQWFRMVVEASPSAMLIVSPAGVITLVNRRAEELFGYTRAELVGQPIEHLLPERFRDAHGAQVQQHGLTGASRPMSSGRDFIGRRKDGTEVPLEIGLNPLPMADGVYTLASTTDVTARRRAEDELRRSNAELEQFAYVASHDLQEPLRMVASFTELLGQRYRGQLDEKADRYIHFAVDGARRMQRLVADLLAYSRVGSQGKPLLPVSSEAVVRRVLVILGATVQSTGATVEYGALPTVLADEGQLHQLFQNLLGNALKFRGQQPPHVRIAAQQVGDRWEFTVADNGIGIELQYADRIFQMFQRLHDRGAYEGSGIGLAIAKRILERHGGRIWLESELGRGTTFHFTIPAVPLSPEETV